MMSNTGKHDKQVEEINFQTKRIASFLIRLSEFLIVCGIFYCKRRKIYPGIENQLRQKHALICQQHAFF